LLLACFAGLFQVIGNFSLLEPQIELAIREIRQQAGLKQA